MLSAQIKGGFPRWRMPYVKAWHPPAAQGGDYGVSCSMLKGTYHSEMCVHNKEIVVSRNNLIFVCVTLRKFIIVVIMYNVVLCFHFVHLLAIGCRELVVHCAWWRCHTLASSLQKEVPASAPPSVEPHADVVVCFVPQLW